MTEEFDICVSRAPQVTVGVPVYNGGACLAAALDSIVGQTFTDIEIVISDNGSTDTTEKICRAFAARDKRVRYFRHQATVSATENFNFVLRQARAPFFMWCAHDDTRNSEFIEVLVAALRSHPSAVLSFGRIVEYRNGVARPLQLDFVQAGRSMSQRLRWAALAPLHHLYGVWRIDQLRKIHWQHVDWWHDTPLMMAATALGEFVYEPKAELHYLHNAHSFFDWDRVERGLPGLIMKGRYCAKRVVDLGMLIWLSGQTVRRVAGMKYGLLAGAFACEKVATQIKLFVGRRLVERPNGITKRSDFR